MLSHEPQGVDKDRTKILFFAHHRTLALLRTLGFKWKAINFLLRKAISFLTVWSNHQWSVIRLRVTFFNKIKARFAFLAHELSRIIARGLRLKRCLYGLFQYSVKCSVVPYCIECTYWRSQNSNRIGRILLDKIKALIQNVYCVKPRSPWTHSILLIVKERWMPKQIAIIDLRGFVRADSTNFCGVSLLNCSLPMPSKCFWA